MKGMKSDDLTLDDLLARLYEITETETLTLCGSSRFGWALNAASRYFTLPPRLYKVYSIGVVKSSDADLNRHSLLSEGDAIQLELLHLQKIKRSSAVCFLNLCQHFGISTQREYEYAKRLKRERGDAFTLLFAEVIRVLVDDGVRVDYQVQFIEDPRLSLA
jgi:hypothetical protein